MVLGFIPYTTAEERRRFWVAVAASLVGAVLAYYVTRKLLP